MPTAPSSVDQVFRHWDPRWPMQPRHLIATKPVFVDVQNVADYSEMMTYERKQIPRIGRCMSPWTSCCLAWHEPLKDMGEAYKLAVVRQGKSDSEKFDFILSGFILQRESKGGPVTIVSGAFNVGIPKGGLLEEAEDGRQMFRMSILGDPRSPLSSPDFQGMAEFGGLLFGPGYIEAMEHAAQRLPTWVIDTQKDIQIMLCAFSFANCRNVQVVDAGRTSPPPRWQKEGVPTVRYSVVKIDSRPVTRRKPGETQEETGRHMGLQLVRGHFKTFTEQKPLLGKHVGSYWWADNVRGDAEFGTIEKSYEIKP